MNASMQDTVFTIGNSTHTQAHFIALLRQHGITALCDVRSSPYSRMNPQVNREELERALTAQGIVYRFLGKELGARSDDPTCYLNYARTECRAPDLMRCDWSAVALPSTEFYLPSGDPCSTFLPSPWIS
jgi:hypothetical protein